MAQSAVMSTAAIPRIAQSDEPPSLTLKQREELKKRKAAYASGTSQGRSWSEVKNKLLSKDGR
jgi:putative addiction module component